MLLKNVCTPAKRERIFDHSEGFALLPYQQACPVGAYTEVRLPRPLHIYPEDVIPLCDGQITINYPPNAKPVAQAGLGLNPVFEYRFEVSPELVLIPSQTKYWQLPEAHDPRPATLHFFAADDTPKDTANADDDFESAATLLGIDATLVTHAKPNSAATTPIPGLNGREWEYQLTLSDRLDHLRGIGRQMQHRDLKHLDWYCTLPLPPKLVLMVSPTSCGGAGGGS